MFKIRKNASRASLVLVLIGIEHEIEKLKKSSAPDSMCNIMNLRAFESHVKAALSNRVS